MMRAANGEQEEEWKEHSERVEKLETGSGESGQLKAPNGNQKNIIPGGRQDDGTQPGAGQIINGEARGGGGAVIASDKGKQESMDSGESVMRRTLWKLNKKHRRLRRKFNKGLSRYTRSLDDELAYSDRQNSVQTMELFKYARVREKLAICLGVLFMFYAASWQPISVFILATMASLMGQYAKQSSWLNQLLVAEPSGDGKQSNGSSQLRVSHHHHHHHHLATSDIEANASAPPSLGSGQVFAGHPALSAYSDQLPMLAPLHSLVRPIFDLASGETPARQRLLELPDGSGERQEDNEVSQAVEDILRHESHQFLSRSFEINGSAFLLGLSQLTGFFLGMTLITWAARRQASRLKILYFKSCLHQEVTWYESIDSASGSGSSLNALVEKYEDGIGAKLALLCYFLGHVTLFACTAFYQMLSLASFCTCFVITVGLAIIYLSGGQAIAIGQQALFAKRSLQLAEEILASIRTVFAFNGQQKELSRYQVSLEPLYRKSLIKHLYTALNTSLSKFSIFACFSCYCFYARHLFPPYTDGLGLNKATVLAVMRGGEVSIVNILISIPFMEALQQSKGSIARIYAAIERRSKINPSSGRGAKPDPNNWQPSISFRMVQFGYADRAGPTQRRRSTLGPGLIAQESAAPDVRDPGQEQEQRRKSCSQAALNRGAGQPASGADDKHSAAQQQQQQQPAARRRRSIIDQLAEEFADDVDQPEPPVRFMTGNSGNFKPHKHKNGSGAIASGQRARANLASERRRKNSGLDHISTGSRIADDKNAVGASADANARHYNTNAANPAAAANINMATTPLAANANHNQETAQDKRILNRFNLEIKAGQSIALVGPSGSGKSTVLSLLLRLYDITGGQLFIGQHNIKDLNVQWLRNQIGVVTQEPRLFDMSIADNICLGLPAADRQQSQMANSKRQQQSLKDTKSSFTHGDADELITTENDDCSKAGYFSSIEDSQLAMQQVIEASKAAGAHDFVMKLPQGYSTRVGSAGVQLSGGQKQRIAIARALIRKPKILLLDESTSALDTESETQVLKALQLASAGRTTVAVAHRLQTIKHVDLIVVMSQGQVIECGTHDELMSMEAGTYKRMYQDQIEANEGQKRRSLAGELGADSVKTGKGHPLDQIEFVTPGGADDNRNSGKTSQAEYVQNHGNHGPGDESNDSDDSDDGCCSDGDDDDDDDDNSDDSDEGSYDDDQSTSNSTGSSSMADARPDFWTLWRFVEPPKWTSMAAILVCLLAGLVLPMNLIAHSYLFSAFAYNELDQIGEYIYFFGLVLLSFSTFVLVVTFLQVILPGYLGEKISIRLRAKTMDSLLHKPMFYFDMDANSAGSLCDRMNSYISSIQNIAGTRIATILEAVSTLMVGAVFGFGQNLTLSIFCLSFALLVLITTVIESRIVQRESSIHQRYDARLAHLMADSLSNIKTIASLGKEAFFIEKFSEIIQYRERG